MISGSLIVDMTLVEGSTPITFFIPNSINGFSNIPSLHPISKTIEFSGIRNFFVISSAYSLKCFLKVDIADEK